jgi:hypothetical protein
VRRLVGRERRLLEQRGERDYLGDEHRFVGDEHWCASHASHCHQRRPLTAAAAVANRVSASRQ